MTSTFCKWSSGFSLCFCFGSENRSLPTYTRLHSWLDSLYHYNKMIYFTSSFLIVQVLQRFATGSSVRLCLYHMDNDFRRMHIDRQYLCTQQQQQNIEQFDLASN